MKSGQLPGRLPALVFPQAASEAAALFKNLLCLHHPFYDFNSTDFFGRMEKITGKEICEILYTAFTDPEADVLDPANLDIFRETLSPRSCKAYFRTYPDLSAEDRDYYLSKLFQFVDYPITSRIGCDSESVEYALDQIPPDLLATAHSRFDVRELRRALAGDSTPSVRAVLTASNLLSKRPMTPGRTGRTQPNKRLEAKRDKLWRQFVAAGGITKDLIFRIGGRDRSQISLWKTGRLKDTSTVTKAIEDGIREFLSERRAVGGS